MLVFDELKKNDPQLRLVALMLAGGLGVLVAGLWWVQVVSSREYQSHQETQSVRTIRIPAARGKILDREGKVLAENQPRYNLSLYLDDLRRQFDAAYGRLLKAARADQQQHIAAEEKRLDRSLTKAERKQFAFSATQLQQMQAQARTGVASALVAQISREIGQPLTLNAADFNQNYNQNPYVPYTILKDADATSIARFQEQSTNSLVAGLELESARFYPYQTAAAHLLGYVRLNTDSIEGEDSYFSYRLPDYRGLVGVEGGFDSQLHGMAGVASVVINNMGYRQSENILNAPEPGNDLVLTIDADLQVAAEKAFHNFRGDDGKGAVVVMDVRNGDVLALVSSPAFNPNDFSTGITHAEWQRIQTLSAEKNRATYENYAPGSIFKPIVGLACLEAGMDPRATIYNSPNPSDPAHGHIMIGKRLIKDTAPPGDYDLRRAILRSSNTYFITNGLKVGVEKIIRLAEKFHLGETTGIFPRQETRGNLPTLARVESPEWRDGDTANICFGQGEVAVTPIQMAVVISAIANGGKVFWPRLVESIEPQEGALGETATNFSAGRVRDELGVSARNLKAMHEAMLAETEDPEGTGKAAVVSGLRICGKTGTAQVQDVQNRLIGWNYWFASFAPYENPRYAVVVLVESTDRGSGGTVCAPIAHEIYKAIVTKERAAAQKGVALN